MIKVTGLDKLQNNLKKMQNNLKKLNEKNEIPFSKLFSKTFMLKYTKFNSIQELIDKSEFKIETQEDFKAIPDDGWDVYIKSTTKFNNWEDMLNTASSEWIINNIGLK
ncbi:hypothetical protein ES702_07572 [subsurface metagenome]